MRAVVTGSSGFVGRHLTRALAARGDSVVAMDIAPAAALDGVERVEQKKADLRDLAALREVVAGADVVHHVASRVQTRSTGAGEVFAINVGGTKNLLEAMKAEKVRRLVYTSSASVVYGGQNIEGGDETLPYPKAFHAPYAETKAIAERTVLEASAAGDLVTCAVRPHIIFGAGDTRFLPAVLSRAKAGKLRAYVGDWEKLSDFTYVDNLVDALLLADDALARGAAAGQAYFVTNGEPMSFWEFIGKVLDGLGYPRPTFRIPYPIAFSAAAVREAVDALRGIPTSEESLTRFTIRYLTTHHYFSNAKAKRELGYQPKVDLAEGVRRTVAAMRSL